VIKAAKAATLRSTRIQSHMADCRECAVDSDRSSTAVSPSWPYWTSRVVLILLLMGHLHFVDGHGSESVFAEAEVTELEASKN
jgi:hypothetical protein